MTRAATTRVAAGADAAAAAGGEATRHAWASLLELAERARAHNLRNGSIVYTHLDFTQKALHFLQSSVQLFYGRDGNFQNIARTDRIVRQWRIMHALVPEVCQARQVGSLWGCRREGSLITRGL